MKSLCFSNVFWNETINNNFFNRSNVYFCNILLTTKVSLKKELGKIWLIYFPLTHSFFIQTVFHKAVGFLCELIWHRCLFTSCLHLAWHLKKQTKDVYEHSFTMTSWKYVNMYKTGIQHRICCKQNHYNTAKRDYLKKKILLKIHKTQRKKS